MPAIADLPLPQRLQRMDEQRLARYRDHLAFYQGTQWPGRSRRGERRLTFNYARRTAAARLGSEDAEAEWARIREEGLVGPARAGTAALG